MPKSPGVSAYLIIDISASEKEMIKKNMNNKCQNNFCIYIMLGFCPFLKVKLFFFKSIFFFIFEFYFAILRNLAHRIARALQLLTFSEFLCLNIQNGTDGNHDSG